MTVLKKSSKYSLLAIIFAIGSIIIYEWFSEAKLFPLSIQFKIFIALSIVTIGLFLAAILFFISERNIKLNNSLILFATLILIVLNCYISHQTIVSFLTPTESEVASKERLEKIKYLQASEVNTISVYRYLQPLDFKNIDTKFAAEGKILVQEIKNKESISDLLHILKDCSFEEWPRYKTKGNSFYIALYSNDNSKIEFDVSHINDTENTYEIFSYNSEDPIYKKYHGAAYSDEIHKWIKAIN
ncbi:MAG: hypothetical protein GY705_27620 [Bacteroidetes bacterium]|nr:hypothetical protein [Bacteroidota bacterium]